MPNNYIKYMFTECFPRNQKVVIKAEGKKIFEGFTGEISLDLLDELCSYTEMSMCTFYNVNDIIHISLD